jgi:hypothetical protein
MEPCAVLHLLSFFIRSKIRGIWASESSNHQPKKGAFLLGAVPDLRITLSSRPDLVMGPSAWLHKGLTL